MGIHFTYSLDAGHRSEMGAGLSTWLAGVSLPRAVSVNFKGEKSMKKVTLVLVFVMAAMIGVQAQTPQPSAFPSSTYNFNLTPITLPGAKTSVAGAETDVKLKITQNFALGETTLISGNYSFIGGRGD